MTGIVKHAENAVAARRELEEVKRAASDVVTELVALVQAMYVFGDMDGLRVNGKPLRETVPELLAATTASEMLDAMRPNA